MAHQNGGEFVVLVRFQNKILQFRGFLYEMQAVKDRLKLTELLDAVIIVVGHIDVALAVHSQYP